MKNTLRFLRTFCPPHLLEEIEGDLIQKFERDVKAVGKKKADRKLIWNTIRFFRPGILLRNKFTLAYTPMQLFQNNIQMAFRNMRKDKLFSSINLFGLTVSLAACLLIFQYVFFELNYDRSSAQPENIYRLFTSSYRKGELTSQSSMTSSTLAPTLKARLPEIVQIGRMNSTRYWFDCTLAYSTGTELKVFNEKNVYFADQAVLSIFSYRLVEGNMQTALTQPYSIVLSERAAKKYFGQGNALGKILRLKGSFEDHDYMVTGIMANPRPDSHLDPEVFASLNTLENKPGFEYSDSYTYVQLTPSLDKPSFENKLHQLAAELLPPKDDRSTQLDMEAIEHIHLHSTLLDQMKPIGNVNAIYLLLTIACIVLLMAWINYVNLTTARSFMRAKEVGIRKISGASQMQVALKFLTEVVLFNVIGLMSAALLAYVVSPYFYSFMNVSVPQNYLIDSDLGLTVYLLLAVFLAGILLSGVFPALSMSSFHPIRVLKGKWVAHTSGFSLRKVTVVFQFTCAITFAIMVLTFNQQFKFMRQQELGVDISKTMILRAPVNVDSTYKQNLRSFKNELTRLAIIKNISTSSAVPGNNIGWTAAVKRNKAEQAGDDFTVNVIDPNFIDTYELTLLAGRNFEEADFPGEHFGDKIEPLILNREGLKYLGFHKIEDAIGATIYWGTNECRLVGVLDNFHQESLKKSIQPQMFTANNGPMLSIKLANNPDINFGEILAQIRTSWNHYFPNNAFDYFFLENAFDEQYEVDEQVARVFNFFCVLALLISCLGLFALSLLSVQLRTKEVSIRKVLGASASHLLQLLTREYVFLILIAATVSIPLSYMGTNEWLSGFAIRIEQEIGLYMIPIAMILVIALLTVGTQTVKVILKNPTESLKHE